MSQAPPAWQRIRAKHLYRVVDERVGDESLPLLAVSIHHGVVPRERLTDDEPRADSLSGYKRCAAGDVVVNRMRAFQGAVGVAPQAGIVSPDYVVLRMVDGVDVPFFHHLFRSTWFVGEMTARLRGIGSSDQGNVRTPRINVEDFGEIVLRLPPLDSQREIAGLLDAETTRIDALIEKKRRMTELLEDRRVAITAAGVANAEWPRVKLTLVARLGSGHTPSRDRPDWWENPTIPWITTGDVAQMRGDRIEFIETTKLAISELGLANSAAELHPAGTVVLSRTASVGFSAIMARPMATSQDFATWTCQARLRPRFLLLCLRAMRTELLGRLAVGSTHKTIYMPDIEAIRVPLPTVEEQERIATEVWEGLRPIDAAVAAIDRHVALLREHRQALITAAVTGQLDVAKAAA
ncbi:MAG: restriction endonuclease subunit S [Gaiella sp.]|nr:restriction endonuclease subunit S [Gaiella sp.]